MASYGNSYDPAKAKALLAQAGYKLNSAGVMTNAKGQSLSFTVINIGDYSDWVADMQVIQQELKAVGIVVTPDNLANTDFRRRSVLQQSTRSARSTISRPSARARTTS